LIVGTKKSQFGWHIDNIINRIGLSPDQVLVPTNFPLNDHDLRDTYNIADVGVTAAFAEGWGYFVTECMATKTPVIAGRHTSNHDFIVDGENGFFVELEDRPYYLHGMVDDPPRYFLQIDDLVNKMMLLYKMKKEQRKEIGENGYKTVKQYEWNLVWQQWEGLFSVI
jgi:glycosyltransferase involved in cell wall biosynthesis